MAAPPSQTISADAANATGLRRTCVAIAIFALAPLPALAHGGENLTETTAWSAWHFTPDIVVPVALFVLVYLAGVVRRAAATTPPPWWRHALFFSGLAAVVLALESPIDPLAERLFWVHQIQHLLLRMLAPMAIALAWPQGVLTAGLPPAIRRGALAPLVSSRVVRALFVLVSRPATVTFLFIAALYVWEIPRYHDAALENDAIHYLMHATMLAAGLVFWWRVFDRRSPPAGTRYGVRLMMLWLVVLSNIVLGAYTTLKTTVLYDAYGMGTRLFAFSPLADEQIGGFIIWVASSMMCLAAILAVIHLWGLHETAADERLAAASPARANLAAPPVSAADFIAERRSGNRLVAFGFAAFAFTVFLTAVLIGVLADLPRVAAPPPTGGPHLAQHAGQGDGALPVAR
jgi:putative membrane protein